MSDPLNTTKTGIKTVLDENFQPSDAVPGAIDGDQLELLSPLGKVEEGKIARERGILQRGAGRPPGSKNRNTEAWRDYLLSRYSSPLIALAETFSRPVKDLAEELGTNRLEAFKIQIACAKELAPYVHQKMPTAIEAGDGGLISLNINMGGQQVIDPTGGNSMEVTFLNIESKENQGVIEAEFTNFDVQHFDVDQNNTDNQDDNSKEQTDLRSVGSDDAGAV